MNLKTYIRTKGPEHVAKLLGVKVRTVYSWLYGARHPNRRTAIKIAEKTPVTLEGIYWQ